MTKVEGKADLRRLRGEEPAAPEQTAATKIAGTFRRVRRGHAVRMREAPPRPDPTAPDMPPAPLGPRPARAAIMLALAHKLQRMLDAGRVRTMADLADMLGVTRARVTQIMDLALLPVALQERVLLGERADVGLPLTERALRHRHTDPALSVRPVVHPRPSAR